MQRFNRLLALSFAFTWPAFAGTPINETRPVDSNARIEIINTKGSVTVSAWDKPEVNITGELGTGAKRLAVDGKGASLRIKVEAPENHSWFSWNSDIKMENTRLDIKVPRDVELKIESVSAEVAVTGTAGRLLTLDTVSGKAHLESDARELKIDSVSGNVDIIGKAERSHVDTVSGDLRVKGLTGDIKLESVSGDIDVESNVYRELNAETVSGDIDLRGALDKKVRINIETMSGNVQLRLPASIAAQIHAESFSGELKSDFGKVAEQQGPGSSLEITAGNGDGQIHVETFSGDVSIRHE